MGSRAVVPDVKRTFALSQAATDEALYGRRIDSNKWPVMTDAAGAGKQVYLLGATGFTGGMLLEKLVGRGLKPILLGRNARKLEALSNQFDGLSYRQVDIGDIDSLQSVIRPKSLLISTVGPFGKFGGIPLAAALACGADYMDSCGEPAFIAKVYGNDIQAAAEQANVTVMTACGFDYVPGQLMGALLMRGFERDAGSLNIGYAIDGGGVARLSPGTVASLVKALFEKGVFFRNSRFEEDYIGKSIWHIQTGEKTVAGLSIPALEGLELPKAYGHLTDVNVFLAFFGPFGQLVAGFNRLQHLLFRIPGYLWLMRKIADALSLRFIGQKNRDPQHNRAFVRGEALDSSGRRLATACLVGPNAYVYTADIMAWIAHQVVTGKARQSGVTGPLRAFGLDALFLAHKELGFKFTFSNSEI